MARAESKQNLGFYATDPKRHAAILSLVEYLPQPGRKDGAPWRPLA
jgi:hypothetical protein